MTEEQRETIKEKLIKADFFKKTKDEMIESIKKQVLNKRFELGAYIYSIVNEIISIEQADISRTITFTIEMLPKWFNDKTMIPISRFSDINMNDKITSLFWEQYSERYYKGISFINNEPMVLLSNSTLSEPYGISYFDNWVKINKEAKWNLPKKK